MFTYMVNISLRGTSLGESTKLIDNDVFFDEVLSHRILLHKNTQFLNPSRVTHVELK